MIFLGFMNLGDQLEQPFGYDDSGECSLLPLSATHVLTYSPLPDLDLDHFCELIGEELQEIVAHPHPSFGFIFSEPFGPHDTRNAVEILEERTGVHGFRKTLAKNFHEHGSREKDNKRGIEVVSV